MTGGNENKSIVSLKRDLAEAQGRRDFDAIGAILKQIQLAVARCAAERQSWKPERSTPAWDKVPR